MDVFTGKNKQHCIRLTKQDGNRVLQSRPHAAIMFVGSFTNLKSRVIAWCLALKYSVFTFFPSPLLCILEEISECILILILRGKGSVKCKEFNLCHKLLSWCYFNHDFVLNMIRILWGLTVYDIDEYRGNSLKTVPHLPVKFSLIMECNAIKVKCKYILFRHLFGQFNW